MRPLIFAAAAGAAVLSLAMGASIAAPAKAPPAKAARPFSHAAGIDYFGYFIPGNPVTVGRWKLDAVSLGDPDEFRKWERGQRTRTYAPVMLEFFDTRSPQVENELGQQVHTVRVRVLPTSYRVAPGTIEFTGQHPVLGRVVLSGALDTAAIARARQGNEQRTAIRAGVEFRGERFRNVSFNYFAGD